ncbi:hypothetical protein FSB78_18410 [Sphingomonas ginsenosidivorax]|uniref:Uncharacterized protein n=1 Tax=Sphingomonas ginsenosidivorax TaxID=862135 RepID=A0A5C6U525_9SPHN|nr:hypothetical protein [Sphingomonas ginsenosidivorax]TXC67962.1 hypothetical protein FSB78_18410 [Sphingomonas ginsenosidivorax]
MPSAVIKQFVVEGAADFPLAMLTADECWPARAADAAAITASQLGAGAATPPRKIILATVSKYAPNRQRWIAAG